MAAEIRSWEGARENGACRESATNDLVIMGDKRRLSQEGHAGTKDAQHEPRLEDEAAGSASGDGRRGRLGGDNTGAGGLDGGWAAAAAAAARGDDDDGGRVAVVPAGDGGGLVLAGPGAGAVRDTRGALGDGEGHGHGRGLGRGGGRVDVLGLGSRDQGQGRGDEGEDGLELHCGGLMRGGDVDQKGVRFDRKRRDVRVGFVKATRSTTIPAFEWEKGDKEESFVFGLGGCVKRVW